MKKGFTLIELLVVIAIITLISGVVLATLSSARKGARDGQRIANARQLSIALEQYETSAGTYKVAGAGAGGLGGGVATKINGPYASIVSSLNSSGFYSASKLLDPVFGDENYYVGICGDGSGYNIFLKVEQDNLKHGAATLNSACDGATAQALGYNYVFNFGGNGSLAGLGTTTLLDFFGAPVNAQTAAAGNVAYYTDSTHVNGSSALNWDAPNGKLVASGVVESTSGGFKFPDGTTQTTAAQGNASKFGQVVFKFDNAAHKTGSTSFVNSGITANITPTNINSKILIQINSVGNSSTNESCAFTIGRGATLLNSNYLTVFNGPSQYYGTPFTMTYLDSPSSTSTQSYSLFFRTVYGNVTPDFAYINSRPYLDEVYGTTQMTLTEILP